MSLHNDIMNIQSYRHLIGGSPVQAYKLGHRDARHAAAELALKAEARTEELEQKVFDLEKALEIDRDDLRDLIYKEIVRYCDLISNPGGETVREYHAESLADFIANSLSEWKVEERPDLPKPCREDGKK